MMREFSPTYSELPPREIYVEASGQSESVRVATTTTTSESDRSLQFPLARRVADDPKTNIFTFEGLTPVSTVDDTREDAIVVDNILGSETGAIRDDNCVVCSPSTSDISAEKDQNDDYIENGQIVLASSSVREKVAAWEKRVFSYRSTGMYDVPFDEDPMRNDVVNADDTIGSAVISSYEFDMTKETITEIPVDEIIDCDILSGDNVEIVDVPAMKSIAGDCYVLESEQITTTQPIACMTNLLDEDEELEIRAAPSDEKEVHVPIEATNRDLEEPLVDKAKIAPTGMVETFGCPDAICTHVSKLWRS